MGNRNRRIVPFTHQFFVTYAQNDRGREMASHAAVTFMAIAEIVGNATASSWDQPPFALGEPDRTNAVMELAQAAIRYALAGRKCEAVAFSLSAPYPKPTWMSDDVYENAWSEEQVNRRRTALRLGASLRIERLERESSNGDSVELYSDPIVGNFLDLEEDVDRMVGNDLAGLDTIAPALENTLGGDREVPCDETAGVGASRIRLPHNISLLLRSVARQCAVAALKGDFVEYERLHRIVRLLPCAVILGQLDCPEPKYVFLVA